VAINTEFQGQGAFDHGRRAVEEARAFKAAIGSQVETMGKAIDLNGRVQRNPIGMVFAAVGVGYLLGGGLFSPLTGKLVKVGLRLALIPVIKSQIAGFVEGAGEGGQY
jgi:hypothetical protein